MLKAKAPVLTVVGALMLTGCSRSESKVAAAPSSQVSAASVAAAAPATAAAPTINAIMTQAVSIEAQTIWDKTSQAFNDRGDGLVAAKISNGDWAELGEAGGQMRDHALKLADTQGLVVAGPGETIMGGAAAGGPSRIGHTWDAASAAQIQARIAAKPTLFAKRARILAQAGDSIAKASLTKDIKTLYHVSSGLDDVCDGCHKTFWGTDEAPPFPK